MADVKISALPLATTPLTGLETVPLVQGGQTRRVTVDNLTNTVGQLPSATTPLSGSELVAVLQGGTLKSAPSTALGTQINFYRCAPVNLAVTSTWYTIATVAVAGAPGRTIIRFVVDAVAVLPDGLGGFDSVTRKNEIFTRREPSGGNTVWSGYSIQSVVAGSVALETRLLDSGNQGASFQFQARRISGNAGDVGATISWVAADVNYATYAVTVS
jgi:hypothetical protein